MMTLLSSAQQVSTPPPAPANVLLTATKREIDRHPAPVPNPAKRTKKGAPAAVEAEHEREPCQRERALALHHELQARYDAHAADKEEKARAIAERQEAEEMAQAASLKDKNKPTGGKTGHNKVPTDQGQDFWSMLLDGVNSAVFAREELKGVMRKLSDIVGESMLTEAKERVQSNSRGRILSTIQVLEALLEELGAEGRDGNLLILDEIWKACEALVKDFISKQKDGENSDCFVIESEGEAAGGRAL